MNISLYTKEKPAFPNQLATHQWITRYIGDRGNEKQFKVAVIKAPRQIAGKSSFCIKELARFSLQGTNRFNGYIAPTLAQAKEAFLKLSKAMFLYVKASNGTSLEIIFQNDSRIKFFSAESGMNLRGFTITDLLVIDEAAFIKDDVWYEYISPWCITNMPLVIMTSTPYFKRGFFYDYFQNGNRHGENTVTTFDWAADYPEMFERSATYLESIRETMPVKKFRTEYLAEWLTEDDGAVFTNILANIRPKPLRTQDTQLYLGIDWGTGAGSDYTSLCFLNEEGHVFDLVYFNDISPVQQVERVKEYIAAYNPVRIQADETSIGRIYRDMLKGLPIVWQTFTNDRKQKWVEALQVAFENSQIKIIDDKRLLDELVYYEMQRTPSNKVTYNAMKGYTDDLVTSLYLAWDLYSNRNRGTGLRVLTI